MTRQSHISRQNPNTGFVECAASVPCTMAVRKRIMANLEQATHSRVGAARARRARQLLEQINSEQQKGQDHRSTHRPSATRPTTPRPETGPTSVPRAAESRLCSIAKRCVNAMARWVDRIPVGRQTRIRRKAS